MSEQSSIEIIKKLKENETMNINNAKKINEKLREKVKTVNINGLEFKIKAIDIFDMLDMADEKLIVLNEARTELGLKDFQAIPKNLREEYGKLVAKKSEKKYMSEINDKTIKEFVATALPKACIDPVVVDKPSSEINQDVEVSLDLMLANLDLSVELMNEILTFSVANSIIYSEDIKALETG